MCGIAGLWDRSLSGNDDALRSVAFKMANALRHRGPDDYGFWEDADAGVALSHRRLSVVDLSPLGRQPMISASGRYVIVYNGEIYNFRGLRRQLETVGNSFRGHSDTEVMLAAITQWGIREAVIRFNGMFAFALWDREERTLYLARDRFGEKPLYYGWVGGTLIFGSELKALRAHSDFQATIDRDALGLYMRYGYVPTPYCIYRDIRKLSAGSILRLTGESDERASAESYWSVADVALRAMQTGFKGSAEEATKEFESLLEDAVRLRLEADVPIGAFLSGGIDSSTIVALMQHQLSRPVKTFTVGFEEAAFNEAKEATRIAEYLGTAHTELYVSSSEAMAVVPRLPTLYDEPFADSSQIPTFLISMLARSHVTVSLSGDGGDELLAGYNRYLLTSRIARSVLRSPTPVRRLIGRALQAVAPGTWDQVFGLLGRVTTSVMAQRHIGHKLHRFGRVVADGKANDAYVSLMSIWDRPSAVVLGTTELSDRTTTLPPGVKHLDGTQRMMLLDALTYLPDDILVKVDRASMGVGLETRIPFLDTRVAEFCWSLPLSMKVRHGQRKWLLRRVLSRHIPQQMVDRPK
ncbi:MAG: asparagine synthase (glutamine-hydrolyzing), partial [Acidobacteria bacterium]